MTKSRSKKQPVVEVVTEDVKPPRPSVPLTPAAERSLVDAVKRGDGVAWTGNRRALDDSRVVGRWNVLITLVTLGLMEEPELRRTGGDVPAVVHRFPVTRRGKALVRQIDALRAWRDAHPESAQKKRRSSISNREIAHVQ